MGFKRKRQKFISLKEAAGLSGYTSDYIGFLIRQGRIPGKKIYSETSWVTTEEAIKEYKAKRVNKKEKKRTLIYDIFPPERIENIAREVSGVKSYKTRRRKILAFSWRAGLATFLIICLITGFAPIKFIQESIRALSQETKIVNLYSQSCEGSWQNVENVQGKPEVGHRESLNSFSEVNSAVYKSGSSYLICQDFVREDKQIEESLEIEPLEVLPIEERTTAEGAITTITTTSTTTEATTTDEAATTEAIPEATTTEVINELQEGTSSQPEETPSTGTETSIDHDRDGFPINGDNLDEENPISFFGNLEVLAQEENEQFKSVKIKFSFAIGEKEADILPIEQTTSTQSQSTSSDSDIDASEASPEPISFWDKIKNFFKGSIVKAEEDGEESVEENPEENIQENTEEEIATTSECLECSGSLPGQTTSTTTEATTTDELISSTTTTEEATTEATTTEIIEEEEASSTDEDIIATTTAEDTIATTTEALPDLERIIIWYSLDGEIWWKLGSISDYPLSNALNNGYFEYNAPFLKNWEDVKNLKIKFEGVVEEETNITTFLDSVWLEVIDEEQKKIEEPEISLLSLKKVFKGSEEPEFQFRYKKNKKDSPSLLASVVETIGLTDNWEGVNVTVEVRDYQGSRLMISPELVFKNNGDFFVYLNNSSRQFKPGKYKLKVEIEDNGQVLIQEQEFIWGVLAINTNKSIYLPSEWAYLQMAALRDDGHTICDANLTLMITTPGGGTDNLTPQISGQCGPNNVTDVPDYFVYYQVGKKGIYQMRLINLDNGYEISDSFEVRNSVPFDVERFGPTRIYPLANYQMTIRVKTNQDFKGEVKEYVPNSFIINSQSNPDIQISNDEKIIIWPADWKAGETYELSYQFDAPDISPYLYLLGPLRIGGFQEIRQWQIAADDAGEVFLFWDGDADAPTGWTCVSCTGGDPYYELFPMGTSTYGGTGGTETHDHTIDYVSDGGPSGGPDYDDTGGASDIPHINHTHDSISATSMDAVQALPSYYELKVIKKANPSTILTGTIAIFDTASLPANWSLYTDADTYIIRGGPNASTTGSGVHTNVAFTVDADEQSASEKCKSSNKAGEFVTHTHSVTGGTTGPPDTLPPYIDIVLAKATADVSLPDGIIAMFDATPPENWAAVSAINDNKFLRASSTGYGEFGGSATTHSHPDKAFTAQATGDTTGKVLDIAPDFTGADIGHTHQITVSFGSASTNIPPYLGTIFAKYTGAANAEPSISNVKLNDGADIYLVEGSATTVAATATVTDTNGPSDISEVIGRIFWSEAANATNCTANAEDCTPTTTCATTTACVENDCIFTCNFDLWFPATPTDVFAGTWDCWMQVTDNQGAASSSTNTSQTIDVITLAALDVTDAINYGLLDIEGKNDPLDQLVMATTTGNEAIDADISGDHMCTDYPACNAATTSITYQKYATSSGVGYASTTAEGCHTASSSAVLLEFTTVKPTATPSDQGQSVYWGTYVPTGMAVGNYTGVNTFAAQSDNP